MRDIRHDINIKEYTITNNVDNYFKTEYFRSDDKKDQRHREDGPALSYTEDGKTYHEWWAEGKLKATFDEKSNKFMKSSADDESFTGLKEANVKERWGNHVSTMSLGDVALCSMKENDLSKESVLGNINHIRMNVAQTPKMEPLTIKHLKV